VRCSRCSPVRLWRRSLYILGGLVVAVIVVATATMLCTVGGASLYLLNYLPQVEPFKTDSHRQKRTPSASWMRISTLLP
jgi:hypothetical protein